MLKKGILQQTQGLEKFRWSDRNAPIAIDGGEKDDLCPFKSTKIAGLVSCGLWWFVVCGA